MMTSTQHDPQGELPLTASVLNILLSLADDDKHGYAIMKDVEEMTDGKMQMGPGTLYGAIKRLLEANLIEESDDRPDPALDDERRKYYRLTSWGQRVLVAEVARLEQLVRVAHQRHATGEVS